MNTTGTRSLPVVMYHYVNRLEGGITVSPERFAEHCRVLAQKGYRGVGLEEAEDYLARGKSLPPGSLLLTFDDGYLDNYIHALPALKAHGHRGVVFAVSNRLEPGAAPRVPLKTALDGQSASLLEVDVPVVTRAGLNQRRDVFLNHAEARQMHEEGTLAVASHSRGHYGVFTGPEHKGFFRPRVRYRTFYRTEMEPVYGLPDFPVKSGLAHRAFLPDPDMVEVVKALVPQELEGAAAFFQDASALAGLTALLKGYAGRMGRFESDEERRERMWREIAGGKEELEAVLGRQVHSLCWPWGECCAEARNLALEAGFTVLFTTREGVNPPGRALAVHRFKGKDKSGNWLASRAAIYSRPWVGAVYARMRL